MIFKLFFMLGLALMLCMLALATLLYNVGDSYAGAFFVKCAFAALGVCAGVGAVLQLPFIR